MSEKIWSDDAWNDYLYWQTQDKKTLKHISQLILDIERNGCMNGIGKPEPLTGDLQGEYSRRINEKDCLVYHMENGRIYITVDTPNFYELRVSVYKIVINSIFRKEFVEDIQCFFCRKAPQYCA